MGRVKRIWYLSPMWAAKVQASPPIRPVSPEPPLLAHTSSESRGTFRQKARSLAPLNGWACAVKICHDRMLEDTNSLDAVQIIKNVDILMKIWLYHEKMTIPSQLYFQSCRTTTTSSTMVQISNWTSVRQTWPTTTTRSSLRRSSRCLSILFGQGLKFQECFQNVDVCIWHFVCALSSLSVE